MSDSEEKNETSPKPKEKTDEPMEEEKDDSPSTNGQDDEKSENNASGDTKTVEKVTEKTNTDCEEKANTKDNSEEMETDSPQKSNTQTVEEEEEENPPKKSKKKKEAKLEESEEEDEDDEPKLGLLEQPVIIESGKREKKKVERLSMTEAYNTTNQPKEIDIPEGVGEKLGDIPRVEFQINKFKAEDLKTLHRVLFGKITAANKVKKNLRQFSGFEFKKDDKDFKKRRDMLLNRNMHMPQLKAICEVLDLEKKGTKEEVADRVIDFCMCPKSSGKKVPQTKKRKRSEGKGKGEKKKNSKKDSKSSKKKKSKEKVKGSDDEEDEDEEEKSEGEEESEEEEEEVEEEDEESEPEPEEAPKKKKAKKETPAKKPAKKETKKKETPKKKAKESSEEEDNEDESSDDEEPLAKKAPSPPTNDELKKLVKKILDGANLEQVTMKTVVKQVYDKYPSFDLSDRKQFIKTTVKQFLS